MSHDGNSGAAQPEYGNDSLDGSDAPYLPAVEASAYGIVAVEHRSNEDLQDNTLNAEQHHATSSTEGGPLPPAATLVEIDDGSSLECRNPFFRVAFFPAPRARKRKGRGRST